MATSTRLTDIADRIRDLGRRFGTFMVGEPDPDKSDLERYGGLSLMPGDSFTRESYGEEHVPPREEREGRSDIPQWWSGYEPPQKRRERRKEK